MNSNFLSHHFPNSLDNLAEVFENFPWENRETYILWLSQSYYFVCHSTRLLALAASRFDISQQAFHLRNIDHLREERGHEVLALRDLAKLGTSIENFPELPVTSAFYQSQYYLIEHRHPTSLFGYILALEALATKSGQSIYEKAQKAHGAKACEYIRVHAEEDEDHLEKVIRQLEQLSPEHSAFMEESYDITVDLYAKMLSDIEGFTSEPRAS